MIELLNSYPIEEIFIFIFLLALGLREIFNLVEFYQQKTKKHYNMKTSYEKLEETVAEISDSLRILSDKMDLLTRSSRDANKSWIVEHYRQIQQNPKMLNDITMDLLEHRYENYKQEGGNSYIDGIMSELREIYKTKGDN